MGFLLCPLLGTFGDYDVAMTLAERGSLPAQVQPFILPD